MRTERKDAMARWKAANPYELVNVASIGTHCGRFPSVDAAKRHVEEGGEEFIGVRGSQVLFRGKVYL